MRVGGDVSVMAAYSDLVCVCMVRCANGTSLLTATVQLLCEYVRKVNSSDVDMMQRLCLCLVGTLKCLD